MVARGQDAAQQASTRSDKDGARSLGTAKHMEPGPGDHYIQVNQDALRSSQHHLSAHPSRAHLGGDYKRPYGTAQSDLMSQQTRAGPQSQAVFIHGSQSPPKASLDAHRRMPDVLAQDQDHGAQQYGVGSEQASKRHGPAMVTSLKGGHPVYVKNLMSQGLHMPSKGLYSNARGLKKPGTAGAPGARGGYASQPGHRKRANFNEVASNEVLSVADGALAADQYGRHESEYRRNMKNIQMFSNYAALRQKQAEFQ